MIMLRLVTSTLSRKASTIKPSLALLRIGHRRGIHSDATNSIQGISGTSDAHSSANVKSAGKDTSSTTTTSNQDDVNFVRTTESIGESQRQSYSAGGSEKEKLLQETNDLLRSDLGSFSPTDWERALSILNNWTLSDHDTEMAWKLFDRLAEEEGTRSNKADPMLTKDQLRHVLGSWNHLPMGITAQDVVCKLAKYRTQIPKLYPDNITYNLLISGAVKQGESPEFAEKILRTMQEIRAADPLACLPSTVTYNAVMDAWSKSQSRDAPEHAEALLMEMEELSNDESLALSMLNSDKTSYSTAITAWAKSGRIVAVDRAKALLARLQDKVKKGKENLHPDTNVYNTLFQALVVNNRVEEADAMLKEFCDKSISLKTLATPDNFSFSIVISGWAKSGNPNAAIKAEELFQRMQELQADIALKPNTVTLNALISVWANIRLEGAAEKAELYLEMMKVSSECQPNATSYNAVISAWANSRQVGAPDKAENLLREMQASADESCKPNQWTYNAVINAWAMSKHRDSTRRAFSLFHEMKESIGVNVITYSTLLKCISSSSSKHKAQEALNLHEEMEASSIEPTVRTMNEVMAACAFSNRKPYDMETRDRAFHIATKMFRRIVKEVKPTPHTFSFFFLSAPESGKKKDIEIVYAICKNLGMHQDPQVLRGLERVAPHLIAKARRS